MAEGEFNQQTGADYVSAETPSPLNRSTESIQPVSWTASEFIAHEKSGGWYLGLLVASVVLAALVYLLTKDGISASVVVVGALFLAIYAGRQPRQLEYSLDNQGVSIGGKYFPYVGFRSFSIVDEGAFSSIVFMPLKRFAATTTIYYAPDDEDKIIDLISAHLPHEEHKPDPVDNLMRRIRF